MNGLYIIFISIITGEIICGIWNLLKTIIFYKKIKSDISNKQELKSTSNTDIIIVIPCLKEQDIICDTIDYFLNITINFNNIKIVIVTTEKEEYEKEKSLYKIDLLVDEILKGQSVASIIGKYNDLISINGVKELIKYKDNKNFRKIAKDKVTTNLTTSQIVKEYLKKKKSSKLVHMHYPKSNGIMADQLNYVLKKYNFKNNMSTYFSVYNADSLPDKNTFEKVYKSIEINDNPKVMQQYSYAYSNISKLPFIMKGFALYQSNFEIKYGLINSIVLRKFLYTYVVGHGMYIRLDVLKELGGFDSHFWCEDIFLSSILRNKNINITPIFALENMETPHFLNIQIKQNAVWFKTSNQWIKMIKANLKVKPKLSLSSIDWFIQRVRMNLSWLMLPLLIIYSLVYSFVIRDYNLFGLTILSYFFMQSCTYITTMFVIEKLENRKMKNKFVSFCSVCLSTFVSNFGPLYSLFNIKMTKYKTVR